MGTVLFTSAYSGEGSFTDLRASVLFQSKTTVQANNANKSIEQVYSDIVAELEAKGFTTLTAS